ncbi:group 1 glycosyl transferase [Nostoc linckia NIES-25]|nr:group 1 glycosyl transferase [Nostoc linckia NIES-25]
MRILMIAHAFPPTFGGVESHLWDISTRLAERGHDIYCLVGGEKYSREELGNFTVVRWPDFTVQSLLARRKGWDSQAISDNLLNDLARIISQSIAEFTPSHVHIHNGHHFAPELALSLFTQIRHIPLVNGVHDRVGEHLFEQIMNYSWDRVLYASHYLKKSIPTRSAASVMWLGIDLTKFSPQGSTDPRFAAFERPIVFHPARLLRWKGVNIGLHAFLELRRRLGKGTLVLCSSENIVDDPTHVQALRNELVAIARNAQAADAVQFLAFHRSEIASAYRASDLVWYPTIDDEPFGLVPLEAMACAIPLIVSRSGGMVETVVDGETGLIVDKNDHNALANAAIRILADETLRTRIVKQGQEHVRMFDADSYVNRLEKLYKEVAAT